MLIAEYSSRDPPLKFPLSAKKLKAKVGDRVRSMADRCASDVRKVHAVSLSILLY